MQLFLDNVNTVITHLLTIFYVHFCVEYYVDKELTYSCQLQRTQGLEMSIRCFKLGVGSLHGLYT